MATLEMLLEWELRLSKKETEAYKEWADRDSKLNRRECMLIEREMELDRREMELDRRDHELFMREIELNKREAEINKRAFALQCYKPMGTA